MEEQIVKQNAGLVQQSDAFLAAFVAAKFAENELLKEHAEFTQS